MQTVSGRTFKALVYSALFIKLLFSNSSYCGYCPFPRHGTFAQLSSVPLSVHPSINDLWKSCEAPKVNRWLRVLASIGTLSCMAFPLLQARIARTLQAPLFKYAKMCRNRTVERKEKAGDKMCTKSTAHAQNAGIVTRHGCV